MTLRQLECFLYLSETLNFARTAEALYISQPSVSREIKALEEEIGVTLFIRSKRSVELTPAGRSLREDLSPLASRFRIAITKAQHCQQQFRQQLTIGYCHAASLMLLPEGLKQFHALHPHIYLAPVTRELRQLNADFSAGSLDVIFGMRDVLTPDASDGCALLYKGFFCTAVAKDHPLFSCDDLTLSAINGHTLIMIDPQFQPPVVARAYQYLTEHCPDSPVIRTPNMDEAQMLLLAGLGVVPIPQYSMAPSAGLHIVPLSLPGFSGLDTLDYCVCWHRNLPGKHAERFVSIMRELYQSEDLEDPS